MTIHKLDPFTLAYIGAALWSTSDESDPDTGGSPMEDNYGIDDIAPDTLQRMADDCDAFQIANREMLAHAGDDSQNGHDFWLTRNHHGAGFWDRGYLGVAGDALSAAAEACGSYDLYIGDDERIHGA